MEVLDYFKEMGAKGGKKSSAKMTPAQRKKRAKAAAAASAKVRTAKAKAKAAAKKK